MSTPPSTLDRPSRTSVASGRPGAVHGSDDLPGRVDPETATQWASLVDGDMDDSCESEPAANNPGADPASADPASEDPAVEERPVEEQPDVHSAPGDMTPVGMALSEFSAALDQLLKTVDGGDLDHYSATGLVGGLRGFEQIRNRMCVVDHRLLAEAEARDLAGHFTHTSTASLLQHVLLLGAGEAHRRLRASTALGDRVSMLGQPLAPHRPHLAAAQRQGTITPEQVQIVERALHQVDRPGFDPAQVDHAEQLLTTHAATFGPRELRILAARVVDWLDPDGTLPKDQATQDRRFVSLTLLGDGSYRLEGRLTGAVGAQLLAVLRPLAAPRVSAEPQADGSVRDTIDERSHGQRMHDGLEEAMARLLRTGGLPASGGTPASVIVTIDLDTLLHHTQSNRNTQRHQENQRHQEKPDGQDGQDRQDRQDGPDGQDGRGTHGYSEDWENEATRHPRENRESRNNPNNGKNLTDRNARDSRDAWENPNTPDGDAQAQVPDERASGATNSARTSASTSPPFPSRPAGCGYGETSDGTLLSITDILRIASEADIIPVVLSASGEVLHLGRTRRLANHHQTHALIARDLGCSFPGCQHSPEWCDRHHIEEWVNGGATDIDNLTLLCRYHHTHFLSHGWTCQINADGIPHWRPPRILDPRRRPLINARILRRHQEAKLRQ